jgi:hypothetical protein
VLSPPVYTYLQEKKKEGLPPPLLRRSGNKRDDRSAISTTGWLTSHS